jgi:Lysozyme like domain
MPAAGPTTHQLGKLSATQVASYAITAGFPNAEVPMAVEVARLESGFDPNKIGKLDPRDLGLMQINSHYHPEVLTINWRDGQENMSLAYRIWRQRGWGEWHTSLAARASLLAGTTDSKSAAASAKATQQQSVDVVGAVGDSLGAAKAGIEALNRTGRWISNPSNILRIVEVVAGGGLLLVAIAAISRPVIEPVAKTAAEFTPAGKAATASKWFAGRPS